MRGPWFSGQMVRLLKRYMLSLASLAGPCAITLAVVGRPQLNPLISFSFVLAVAVSAWYGGFWAGILVSVASGPALVLLVSHGRAFLPPKLDPAALGVMFLISLLASRVAAIRRRVLAALRTANQDLEVRVAERTSELNRAREWLQITLGSIGDAVIATNREGRVTFLNGVAQDLTGWSEHEAVGRRLEDVFVIVREDTREPLGIPVSSVLSSGAPVALADGTLLLGRDGREMPIDDSGAPIRTAEGETAGVVLVFRDITERRRAERERKRLREADERLVGILANIQDGFVAVDREWRPIYLNRKAAELLRRPAEELLGVPLWEALPAAVGEATHHELQRAMADGAPVQVELQYAPFQAWLEISAHPNTDGMALFIHDATAQKRLEDQLRQALKMEAVGRLAGGIAHDFNNLLTVINGYADMLVEELPRDSPLRDTLGEISKAGRRAAELTGGLLAFSRKQMLQPSVLDLNRVVREIQKMLGRLLGEDIEVRAILSPGLWELNADRSQLEQVIMNLAINARDAMPGGGRLTIETANVELDISYPIAHFDVRPGEYVLLVVSDTGHGMDKLTRAQIFEPFFTTKGPGKGTGLGLSTVYGIVKQSGGTISVYSEPGHGTSFKIYLPRLREADPECTPKSTGTPAVASPRGSETILLVEDDDSLRKLATVILERHGFCVLAACSGAEALRICRRHKGEIDLVLADMVMPQMSGSQLAVEVGRDHPGMKFLLMSGYTEHALVHKIALDANASFLGKPFTAEALIAKVQEVLGTGKRNGQCESGGQGVWGASGV